MRPATPMDTQEIPADDPEQRWIAKYRKALDAAATKIHKSRSANIRAAIVNAYKIFSAGISKILAKRIRPKSARPTPKLGLATVPKIPARGIQPPRSQAGIPSAN
jgi:hypothetical protein